MILGIFLGVASVDILISSVEKSYENNTEFIERVLKSRSRLNFSRLTTNTCQLDKIRTLKCIPEAERVFCDINRLFLNTFPECPNETSKKVLCDRIDKDGNKIITTKENFTLVDFVTVSPCCINCNYSNITIIIIIAIYLYCLISFLIINYI